MSNFQISNSLFGGRLNLDYSKSGMTLSDFSTRVKVSAVFGSTLMLAGVALCFIPGVGLPIGVAVGVVGLLLVLDGIEKANSEIRQYDQAKQVVSDSDIESDSDDEPVDWDLKGSWVRREEKDEVINVNGTNLCFNREKISGLPSKSSSNSNL